MEIGEENFCKHHNYYAFILCISVCRIYLIIAKNSGDDSFKRLKEEFPENTELLMEKGVFFYDYAGNYDVFSQHKFPPHSAFYSQLQDENITKKDYQRGSHVFNTFNCKTLLDYMLLYVKLDTG